MKISKRLLSLLLCSLLCMGLFPVQAFAADVPYIIVGGTQVTEANQDNVLGNNTVRVFYDADVERWVIDLENADISVTGYQSGIYARVSNEMIEIRLHGTNKITSQNQAALDFIWCDGLITGDGTLELISEDTAVAGSSSGGSGGSVYIRDVSLFQATGFYSAVNVVDSLTIENSTVKLSSTADPNFYNAVAKAGRKMTFADSDIIIDAGLESTYGILTNTLSVTNGKLEVEANNQNGIYAQGDILFENGASATITSSWPAIYGESSTYVNNSTLNVISSGSNGIYVIGDIQIENNASVTATGYYPGLFSEGYINIDNSVVVSESSDDCGLWSTKGISILGESDVKASGSFSALGSSGAEYISVTPYTNTLTEVKVGSSSADAEHFADSPFGAETDLLLLSNNGNYIEDYAYFHCKTHTHEGGTATCHEKAICADCNKEYGDVASENHAGGTELRNTKEATCVENGYTGDTYCLGCGNKIAEGSVTSTISHDFSGDFDAYDENYHWHICNRDGCDATDEKQAHSFTNYVCNNDATCTDDQTETAKCDFCDATDTRTVVDSAIGHSWGEPVYSWSEDGKSCTATFTCANDESHTETITAIITSEVKIPATCMENGITTYTAAVTFNDEIYTATKDVADIAAIGHGAVKTNEKAATCTENGNIVYWYCPVCGKYFSDEALTIEISQEDTIIKATGHEFSDAWKTDEANHWHECICGEKTEVAAHRFKWVVDQEATTTEKGSKHEECEDCGYKKAAVEIPVTGTGTTEPADSSVSTDTTQPSKPQNSQSPQTGDNSGVMLWILLFVFAGAGLTVTAFYSRRKNENR